ncbi:MAG: 3-mercaptopyruvate sulfurtransferase [Paracoccus sp. BP8]|nr:MAG: 3-mercaptopyruvate sulfurtransferase [Paracoccus sp. BP8]
MTSLVTTAWLADHLDDPQVVLLDASFKLPGATPTAPEEFAERHIPTAQFFDVDKVADGSNPLPHMMPSEDEFARTVGALGISNDTMVVIYDTPGLMSAGRAWWMFRSFGHRKLAILDGGLKAWMAEGRPVTAEVAARPAASYRAQLNPAAVASKADVLANIDSKARDLVDARSAARFAAEEKEARPGLRSGHVPGSLNVPFDRMTDPETGRMKSPSEIAQVFRQAGLDMERPVIASCGSGVTACALAFGLHLAGKDDVAVYDGSWAEWGMPGDTPVATGK